MLLYLYFTKSIKINEKHLTKVSFIYYNRVDFNFGGGKHEENLSTK